MTSLKILCTRIVNNYYNKVFSAYIETLSSHYSIEKNDLISVWNNMNDCVIKIKYCKEKTLMTGNKSQYYINNSKDWIESYKNNNNTGNIYEIEAGLSILAGSGLVKKDELPKQYNKINVNSQRNNIIGIINLTQKDNIGGTADIGVVYTDNKIKYYSITLAHSHSNSRPSKCIINPTGKHYGLVKNDEVIDMNNKSYKLAYEFRENTYGKIPNKKWKRVPSGRCPGSKLMCEYLAKNASNEWNKMNKEYRKKMLARFLDLDSNYNPNANGIIYWNSKSKCIDCVYEWSLNIDLKDYLDTYSDGIYIYHGKPNDIILKTQAKYNNGIIEGMSSKKSPEEWSLRQSTNYLSSWNANAPDLKKIYKLKEIHLFNKNDI